MDGLSSSSIVALGPVASSRRRRSSLSIRSRRRLPYGGIGIRRAGGVPRSLRRRSARRSHTTMMVLAMRAARVTTSVMGVILPRGRDLLPICPSQPGPRGSTRWGPLAPQSPRAAPSLSPRFRRLRRRPLLDSANVDGAPSILTHAPVGCGRLRPTNRLFYGDNLTVLREAVASESVPRSPAHERDPQGCAYDEGGGDQPARF